MKVLTIIVPYHVSDYNFINFKEMIDSIKIQKFTNSLNDNSFNDIKMWIVSDSNIQEDEDRIKNVVSSLNKSIGVENMCEVISVNFKNPGLSRQAGINESIKIDGDDGFITFMDADDTFFKDNALDLYLDNVKQYNEHEEIDYITTTYLQEVPLDFKNTIINPNTIVDFKGDSGFVYKQWKFAPGLYGYIVRKSFLIKNKIEFSNDLILSEDAYFIDLIKLSSFKNESIDKEFNVNRLRSIDIQEPVYMWKWNEDSLTRKQDENGKNEIVDHEMYWYFKYWDEKLNYVENVMPDKLSTQLMAFIIATFFKYETKFKTQDEIKFWDLFSKAYYRHHMVNFITHSLKKYVKESINDETSENYHVAKVSSFKSFYKKLKSLE